MKKYSIVVTIIALGFMVYSYILSGGFSSPDPVAASVSTTRSYLSSPSATQAPARKPAPAYTPSAPFVYQPMSATATKKPTPTPRPVVYQYIINTSTHIFHLPSCPSVKQIKKDNYKPTVSDRSYLIKQGLSPCGRCNP